MKSADKIQRLFDKAAVKTNAAADDAVFEPVQTAYTRKIENRSAQVEPITWRFAMKSQKVKITIAAAIVLVGALTMSLWQGNGAGIALADVADRIEQVGAYACKMSATFTNQDGDNMPVSEAKVLIARDLGMKTSVEIHNPITGQNMLQEIYVLPAKRTITTLMPNEKKYSQVEFDEAALEGWQKEYDPGAMVEKVLQCEHTPLGRSTIDGVEVEGFQTTDPNFADGAMGQVDVKIWVDVQTKLPVRMDVDKSKENKGHMQIVVNEFQWDVSVDPADFEPVIPDDYTPGQAMMQILPKK